MWGIECWREYLAISPRDAKKTTTLVLEYRVMVSTEQCHLISSCSVTFQYVTPIKRHNNHTLTRLYRPDKQ